MRSRFEDCAVGFLSIIGSAALGTLLVLLIVGAATNSFFDTSVDGSAATQIHSLADVVAETFADLSFNVSAEIQLSCEMSGIECPHRVSGITVTSIVMAGIAWLSLVGVVLLKCFGTADNRNVVMRIRTTQTISGGRAKTSVRGYLREASELDPL